MERASGGQASAVGRVVQAAVALELDVRRIVLPDAYQARPAGRNPETARPRSEGPPEGIGSRRSPPSTTGIKSAYATVLRSGAGPHVGVGRSRCRELPAANAGDFATNSR